MLLTRRWSLQSLLVALAVLVSLIAWIAGGAMIWRVAERHAQELHDGQLNHMAHLLLGLSGHELIEIGDNAQMALRIANGKADGKEPLGDDYRYQLWTSEGRLLLTNFGLPSAASMARLGHTGYSWTAMDGERWRVYSFVDADLGHELQVAERASRRDWLASGVDGQIFAWIALSLVLVLVPALWMLHLLLRPLRHLAQQLGLRSASDLKPLDVPGAPTELLPIVTASNSLFRRVEEAIRHERSFTALAAHELRTPLAALRMQAQVAASTTDEQVRQRNLRDLVQSASRCAHLQDQLLTMARLDATSADEFHEAVDMTEVVMDAVSEMAAQARLRRIRLVTHSDGITMRAHPFGLRTLLRNLVSNAVRYAPEDGRIEVLAAAEGGAVRLTVQDSGPGIRADLRERAFGRFDRLDAAPSDGVGLGLSIVRAVADAHGAEVSLGQSPLGGLEVVVLFVDRLIATADADDLVDETDAIDS